MLSGRAVSFCRLELHTNCFGFGIKFKDIVTHFATPARLLVSTKRHRSIENIVAIDPNGAGSQLRREAVPLGYIIGPDTCREPVVGLVGGGWNLAHVTDRHRDYHRAEDLFSNDFHFGL